MVALVRGGRGPQVFGGPSVSVFGSVDAVWGDHEAAVYTHRMLGSFVHVKDAHAV